jgi:molybdopterin synthase sulfur carrier subunit
MATVWIPSLMQDLTGGRESVVVPGATLREVVANLEAAFPGLGARLCSPEGAILPYIAVAVDGEAAIEGMRSRISEESEVHFLPAISGG